MVSPGDVGFQSKDMDPRKHPLKGLSSDTPFIGDLNHEVLSTTLWCQHRECHWCGGSQQWKPLHRCLPGALFKPSHPPSWLLPSLYNWSQMQGDARSWWMERTQGKEPQDSLSSSAPATWLMVFSWVGGWCWEEPALLAPLTPLKPLVAAFPRVWWYVLTMCHKDTETSHPLMPAQNFKQRPKRPQCLERVWKFSLFWMRKVVGAEIKDWLKGNTSSCAEGSTV